MKLGIISLGGKEQKNFRKKKKNSITEIKPASKKEMKP